MSKKISIGKTSNFPEGKAQVARAGDTAIVVNHVNGQFYAVENRCPHMGLPLGAKKVEGAIITCPFHGSKFDMCTGENLDWVANFAGVKLPEWSRKLAAMGKKPQSLKTFRVFAEDEILFVEI